MELEEQPIVYDGEVIEVGPAARMWVANAPLHEGSWWEAMHAWLHERSGKPVAPPAIDAPVAPPAAPAAPAN